MEKLLPPEVELKESTMQEYAKRDYTKRLTLPWYKKLSLLKPNMADLRAQFVQVTSQIRGLTQLIYPATKVYVTFETEKAQRHVLTTLAAAKYQTIRNKPKDLKTKYLFRESKVLDIDEPQEPSTIRWEDLNASVFSRLRTAFLTNLITVGAMVLSFVFVIYLSRQYGVNAAATGISIMNTVFPTFTKVSKFLH